MTLDQTRLLTQAIGRAASRLGFQLFGVTTPDPPPHLDVYEHWLKVGRHGEMGYLSTERARQRRADPLLILPECRSIIVLGIRYPAPTEPASLEENSGDRGDNTKRSGTGQLAAYALGEDYHDVIAGRLRDLVSYIEDQVGGPVPHRWYTDTGPLLERELAQRAGLGWIGKNTCLINPSQGSYFLLAEVMLGIDLAPSQPFLHDRCGSCHRCLEACPTNCILVDRTIDSRRCISYLTIELKGPILQELRSGVRNWVFGCDICQQVCPWNQRFTRAGGDPAFSPRPGVSHPELIQELALTPETFSRKFKGSPVKRAKRRGYLRNVAVALGNHGTLDAAPALEQALLYDPEPLVRGHTAWALGRIGGEAARQALAAALIREADAFAQVEIRLALRNIEDIR